MMVCLGKDAANRTAAKDPKNWDWCRQWATQLHIGKEEVDPLSTYQHGLYHWSHHLHKRLKGWIKIPNKIVKAIFFTVNTFSYTEMHITKLWHQPVWSDLGFRNLRWASKYLYHLTNHFPKYQFLLIKVNHKPSWVCLWSCPVITMTQ